MVCRFLASPELAQCHRRFANCALLPAIQGTHGQQASKDLVLLLTSEGNIMSSHRVDVAEEVGLEFLQ